VAHEVTLPTEGDSYPLWHINGWYLGLL